MAFTTYNSRHHERIQIYSNKNCCQQQEEKSDRREEDNSFLKKLVRFQSRVEVQEIPSRRNSYSNDEKEQLFYSPYEILTMRIQAEKRAALLLQYHQHQQRQQPKQQQQIRSNNSTPTIANNNNNKLINKKKLPSSLASNKNSRSSNRTIQFVCNSSSLSRKKSMIGRSSSRGVYANVA